MGLYRRLSADIEVVDVIIIGGGTAGCVIAGRLAEADPNLSILLIEGGTNNDENPDLAIPAKFAFNISPKTTLFLHSKKSDELAGRSIVVPTGGILGGGSAMNFLMYTRAQRDDYDSWATPGWSANELNPYLKKLETYHGPRDEKNHGYSGPIHVSDGTLRMKKTDEAIFRATTALGWPQVSDLQTLDRNNAFAPWKHYITPDGKRSDAAHAFIHPLLRDEKHPNLHVLIESQVVRILFEEKRACGVEFRPNPLFQEKGASTPERTVHARKLVVLSSGACNSPSILERSGIGAANVLEEAGVPLLVDLPGVGHDYQDHLTVNAVFQTSLEPHETMEELLSGELSFEKATSMGDPRLGWTAIGVAGKCRPTDEEVRALGPEFKAVWDRDFRDKPNRPLIFMIVANAHFPVQPAPVTHRHMSITCCTPYLYSRGHLHITGPNIDDPVDFDVGFFQDKSRFDVKTQVWAYKKAREVMRRTPFYRGEPAEHHPPFAADSKVACSTFDSDYNLDISNIKDLEYSPEDDKVIEQFVRKQAVTMYHSMGTAKMAPRDEFGVVDKDLNVYGVKGLKVADMSIAPKNVAANTNNTALAIGEKAADIIIQELLKR
ncbi:GMC oxidoreductase [Xylaria nigripes]|nr:GMC oxidoreductase [Xylaria nigripes]